LEGGASVADLLNDLASWIGFDGMAQAFAE
jgi:hypothetical protein